MDAAFVMAVVGPGLTLAGIVVANRYTARTARAAQTTTADVENRKIDSAGWQAQVDSWRKDVAELRELRSADRAEFDRDTTEFRTRIEALESDRDRIRTVQQQDRIHLDALVSWGRVVVGLLRKAGLAYPPAPPGLGDTDPGSSPSLPVMETR